MIYPPALSPNATATDRFIWVLDFLRIAIAERHRELGGPTTTAVWTWVGSYRRRFMSLAKRVLAGEVARVRPFRPAASRPPPAPAAASKLRLPTTRSWMCVMVPCRAAATGGHLAHMLATDTELMALVASDPRFGRLLRPLLWATGQRHVPPSVPPPAARSGPPRSSTTRAATARADTPGGATPDPVKRERAPRPVKPVTGRALRKYLPWTTPRPLRGAGGSGSAVPVAVAKTKA